VKNMQTLVVKCGNCGVEMHRNSVAQGVQLMRHIDDTLDNEKIDKTRQFVDELMKKAEATLLSENVYLTRVYQLAISKTRTDEVERLLALHLKAIPCLEICYPHNHPTMAQHHINIAMLFAKHHPADEDALHSLTHYERAFNMLRVCLGEDHPKTQSVFERLRRAGGEKQANLVFQSH